MKNKFRVGMIIESIDNHYGITCKSRRFKGEVLSVRNEEERLDLSVKVIDHNNKDFIGDIYDVESSHFKVVGYNKNKSNIDIFIKENKTISTIDGSAGVAVAKEGDYYSEDFGIVLSLIRALKFDKEFENKVIDIYFNGSKNSIEDFSIDELIREIDFRL